METKIIKKIQELFPEHAVYSEERGEISGKSEYVWFIDPIDGTINFAKGQKCSINLVSISGKEEFYEKCGFKKIPFDYTGYGMIKRIER